LRRIAKEGISYNRFHTTAFGPRTPWLPGLPAGIADWTPNHDTWELYKLAEDWSQANDIAAAMPEELEQMKQMFLAELTKNEGLPVGGGLWVPALHPELRLAPTIRTPCSCFPSPGAVPGRRPSLTVFWKSYGARASSLAVSRVGSSTRST
jgi:arylsulfatase